MASYIVQTPNGSEFEVEIPERDAHLQALPTPPNPTEAGGFVVPSLPERALGYLPAIGGTVGGMLGKVGGPSVSIPAATFGGSAGEAYKQLGSRGLEAIGMPVTPGAIPATSTEAIKRIAASGAAQGAAETAGGAVGRGISKAASSGIGQSVKRYAGKLGRGFANLGQALSGVDKTKFVQMFKYPKAFFAESTESSGSKLGVELKKHGLRTTLKPKDLYDPQLNKARKTAVVLVDKVDRGKKVGLQEIVDGKKAINRLLKKEKDKEIKALMMKDKIKVDTVLGRMAPKLKGKQKAYAASALAEDFRSALPVTKSGDVAWGKTAVLSGVSYNNPILGGLLMAGSSPFVAGGVTAASGGLFKAAKSPWIGRGLFSLIAERLREDKREGQKANR